MNKRSLYQCFNARVSGEKIYCAKGHLLGDKGVLHIRALVRGKPLELSVCQTCSDYDEMGPPVAKEDRGWSQTL
jgi:hypothetical protein